MLFVVSLAKMTNFNAAQPWVDRANTVLRGGGSGAGETISFALSFVTAVYGPKSEQLIGFKDAMAQISKGSKNGWGYIHDQEGYAGGVIRNTVAEIESGLIANLREQIAGEVFGELVALGKNTLSDGTESAKNVAAVLIAAAFEDIIRRMGTELAGISGRPKLEEVITALKNANVLTGSEVGIAQSYLNFRNKSLHAEWD